MNNQLVGNCIQILRIFSSNNDPTGLGVNKVFKKTGSKDKKPITDAIKHLEKAGLLESKRSTQHMQVKLKRPTVLGNEFIDFMNDIDEYDISCLKFRDKVKEFENVLAYDNEKSIKSKLREKGWSTDEINSYKDFIKDTPRYVGLASPPGIIDIIITRYISSLANLGSYDKNEMASQILYHIIMNAISNQFKSMLSSGELDKVYYAYNSRATDKWCTMVGAVMQAGLLDHSFIKEEFKDIMFHVLHILTPIEGHVKILLKEMDEMVKYYDDIKDEIKARRARALQSICVEAYKN